MNYDTPPPQANIIVLGSLNIDFVRRVLRLPSPGETVIAQSSCEAFGGKGANQAVAAARQGGKVLLVGAVGNDSLAVRYRKHLRAEGIRTEGLSKIKGTNTGSAHVYLDGEGENMIVVEPGANSYLQWDHVKNALQRASSNRCILLTQFECPINVVAKALKFADEQGIPSVLNASPVDKVFEWGMFTIDTVIVNEHECRGWFGRSPSALWESQSEERLSFLAQLQINHLIVTRGKEPTLYFSGDQKLRIPGIHVTPIDTVGAGDTFTGALTVQIAENRHWEEAIRHANVSGALATLSPGAQTAMPSRQNAYDARTRLASLSHSAGSSGALRR